MAKVILLFCDIRCPHWTCHLKDKGEPQCARFHVPVKKVCDYCDLIGRSEPERKRKEPAQKGTNERQKGEVEGYLRGWGPITRTAGI
jgi:hypothetical protein